MGLIKAIIGAGGGALADQWKEFFYCDSLPTDILMKKGEKQITSRGSNTKANDNIITNGSGIAVADGQCMIIVEQGRVVELCAEPGEFTYDSSSEPSIFAGSLGQSIINTFKTIGRRITYGGETGKDQRVYYFNIKEILENPFGVPDGVPFRVVDNKIGLDVDVTVKCHGYYSFKISDPLLFYTNISANVKDVYKREELTPMLKSNLITYLTPAFAELSNLEIRPNQIPAHNIEIRDSLKKSLSVEWGEKRGLELVDVSFSGIKLPKEDEDMIKELQKTAVFTNASMGAAHLVSAQGEAMKSAAQNSAGAMTGFMGLGFAQNAGGGAGGIQGLYAMGAQQDAQKKADAAQAAANSGAGAAAGDGGWTCAKCGTVNTGKFCQGCGEAKPAPAQGDSWTCAKCGTANTGKFCQVCGEAKPAAADGWTCECGTVNKGKFCQNCGKPKPAGEPLYRCDKCGWEPEDPKNPPKFCPQCGDPFDSNDVK